MPGPKREQLKNILQVKALKSWPTKASMGLKGNGEGEKVSQTLLLENVVGAGLSLCQGSTYCYTGVPQTKGMITEQIWTKKLQDSEHTEGLELVLSQRNAQTYLKARLLVGKRLQVYTGGYWKYGKNQIKTWWGCSGKGFIPTSEEKTSSRPLFPSRSPAFTKESPGTVLFEMEKY